MVRLSIAALFIVASILWTFDATPLAQGPDYPELVQAYGHGHVVTAVAALSRWDAPRVLRAIRGEASPRAARDLATAAMLHTEVANTTMTLEPALGELHIRAADELLDRLSKVDKPTWRPFARRWYLFVISALTASARFRAADYFLQHARMYFVDDQDLEFAQAVMAEMGVKPRVLDLKEDLSTNRQRRSLEVQIRDVSSEYARIVDRDPHYAPAWLRLGWLHYHVGDDDHARQALSNALAHAESDASRYTAHLLLGAVLERAREWDAAQREYMAALWLGPAFQTAYVGLSRVAAAAGDLDAARRYAEACVTMVRNEADPWWDFRIGFDRESLEWLRSQVIRP